MLNASDLVLQYSMVPLRLGQGNEVIWQNPFPNAATSARPIFPLRAGESAGRVKDLVVKQTDEGRKLLSEENVVEIDGVEYDVRHEVVDRMKDLKLIKEWSGLGGEDCLLCETKRKDWKDVEQIERGFPITSVAEETKAICHQLVSDDGEIKHQMIIQ